MRRLTVAFLILISAAILAACGDTGDHFLEFRKAPPGPTAVKKLALAMPIVAGPRTKHAVFKLYITGYDSHNQAIPQGTTLANPITLHTNWSGLTFAVGGKQVNSAAFGSAPTTIAVTYNAPKDPCDPVVGIVAFDQDANPQTDVLDVVQNCPSTKPSATPSTGPTTKPTKSPKPTPSPTPTAQPVVGAMTLSMPSTPNPNTNGTFTLFVTAFDPTGKTISPGTTLTNPITLSSNDSCSISYTTSYGNGTSVALTAAPGSVTVDYTASSSGCPRPSNGIILTASAVGASPNQVSFAILGGTSTVASLTITTLAAPDPTSEGVYPLFVTAKDSGGNVIPAGMTLSNPISLSSNASCATTFGFVQGGFSSTLQISTTQNQVYMQFLGSNNGCTAPPATVIVTGVASGGVSNTYTFPF